MSASTSNLTRFFRNSGHFEALEHLILPDLTAHSSLPDGLRAWSAGCSTGEEAFSLAMLLQEVLPGKIERSIHATDRSTEAIEAARRAEYRTAGVAGIPVRFRERYLQPAGDAFVVSPEIRKQIAFEVAPIESSEPPMEFDLVLCRNVLTYADEKGKRSIIDRLWRSMAPYSYLLVGGAESLLGLDDRFEYLECEWTSYYRKRVLPE